MDQNLTRLAEKYGHEQQGNVRDHLKRVYLKYLKQKEQALLDAVAAATALSSFQFSDGIDYDQITPQMREAFEAAFPNMRMEELQDYGAEQLQGVLSAWKGKYFEVLVRDRLNEGEWVGDIRLEAGQQAVLAEELTQTGWDLQIINADGSVADALQLKATDSLAYAKDALEKYPDFDIVSTDEIAQADLMDRIFPSGIDDASISEQLVEPLENLLGSPFENIVETILPGLPFLIIAVGEGRHVMVGRKSFSMAMQDGAIRSFKTVTAMGAGYLVYLLDGGLLSIPTAFLVRLGLDRLLIQQKTVKRLVQSEKELQPLASKYG
ncbi:hypothetical protein ACX8XN_18520 [Calditrichota bacterium GD2]